MDLTFDLISSPLLMRACFIASCLASSTGSPLFSESSLSAAAVAQSHAVKLAGFVNSSSSVMSIVCPLPFNSSGMDFELEICSPVLARSDRIDKASWIASPLLFDADDDDDVGGVMI